MVRVESAKARVKVGVRVGFHEIDTFLAQLSGVVERVKRGEDEKGHTSEALRDKPDLVDSEPRNTEHEEVQKREADGTGSGHQNDPFELRVKSGNLVEVIRHSVENIESTIEVVPDQGELSRVLRDAEVLVLLTLDCII